MTPESASGATPDPPVRAELRVSCWPRIDGPGLICDCGEFKIGGVRWSTAQARWRAHFMGQVEAETSTFAMSRPNFGERAETLPHAQTVATQGKTANPAEDTGVIDPTTEGF